MSKTKVRVKSPFNRHCTKHVPLHEGRRIIVSMFHFASNPISYPVSISFFIHKEMRSERAAGGLGISVREAWKAVRRDLFCRMPWFAPPPTLATPLLERLEQVSRSCQLPITIICDGKENGYRRWILKVDASRSFEDSGETFAGALRRLLTRVRSESKNNELWKKNMAQFLLDGQAIYDSLWPKRRPRTSRTSRTSRTTLTSLFGTIEEARKKILL